jgi:hypothetical protein
MQDEKILSDKEFGELIDRSIEKSVDIFHSNIWEEFKDSEEFDIDILVSNLITECTIFLTMRDWSKKDIRENVEIGISIAKEAIKDIKKEEVESN